MNFLCGQVTTWLMLIMSTASFTCVAWLDTHTTARIVREQQEYDASGGRTLVATNEDAGVSQRACESLNLVSGVAGAAAITPQQNPAGLASSPDANIPIATATAGISRLMGIDELGDAVLFDINTARRLGLIDSSLVRLQAADTSDGPTNAAATEQLLPPSTLRVRTAHGLSLLGEDVAGGAILPAAAVGRATYCVVQPTTFSQSAIRDALPALLGAPRTGTPTIVSDRLLSGRFVRNFAEEYQNRLSSRAATAAGIGIGMLWVLLCWTRRDQDALYSTLGAGLAIRAIIRVSEVLLLLGTASVVSITLAANVGLTQQVDPDLMWPSVVGNVGLCTSTALLTALLAAFIPVRSPLSALKDR
ncbi:hypothetical protein [uncultured Nocardioides sp.]|uniref:hypothetical protein n=1 Tax=uncultured Nocardioides sp. TaxID=198441 RepID=UPI00262D54FA|nr:hypothetical protein [uncultured Nocardioides sp.]